MSIISQLQSTGPELYNAVTAMTADI